MGEDEFRHKYLLDLVDKGIVKRMQNVLGTDDESAELAEINIELNRMLKEKEKEYKRIEYMIRMVKARMVTVEAEKRSKRMVKRGYFIEGEI